MTPRERLEVVARIAWGVSRVAVSVYPDVDGGVRVFVSVPRDAPEALAVGWRSESSHGADEDAALERLTADLAGQCAASAVRLRAVASAAEDRAQHAERLARCLAETLARMEAAAQEPA